MKKVKVLIVVILSVVTSVATAQNFGTVSAEQTAIQSQQIMNGGAYNGTVYEPFGSTTPSEQSTVGSSQNGPAYSPGGPNRFPKPGETGQSEESPIGDAMWPMLICAAVFCGVIALRRKRSAEKAAR